MKPIEVPEEVLAGIRQTIAEQPDTIAVMDGPLVGTYLVLELDTKAQEQGHPLAMTLTMWSGDGPMHRNGTRLEVSLFPDMLEPLAGMLTTARRNLEDSGVVSAKGAR